MANNVRNAGRKRALSNEQIEQVIERHNSGETVTKLAKDYCISRQTLSSLINRYGEDVLVEIDKADSQRFLCRSLSYWSKINADITETPTDYLLRMDYMNKDTLCTAILVDYKNERIAIKNYTDKLPLRAFGIKVCPDWEDFNDFLKDRCIPEGRDRLKQTLEKMGISSYDPLSIIEVTKGVMAEDDQWIKLIYRSCSEACI